MDARPIHAFSLAKALKLQIQEALPSSRIFLDVDDLHKVGQLEELVHATEVFVAVLAGEMRKQSPAGDGESVVEVSRYFGSENCRREIQSALEHGKRIVLLQETDPNHGAISMAAHRRDCENHMGKATCTHIFASPVVPWRRGKGFRDLSLRLVLEALFHSSLAEPAAPSAIYLGSEVERVPWELPSPCGCPSSPGVSVRHPSGHHVYVSAHNPGVHKGSTPLLQQLRALAREASCGMELAVADNPSQMRDASCFLLYLNAHTFTDETHSERLQQEIRQALAAGLRLVMALECRAGAGSVPFDEIAQTTPFHFKNDTRLYDDLALPVFDGVHETVSVQMLLREITREVPRDLGPKARSRGESQHVRSARGTLKCVESLKDMWTAKSERRLRTWYQASNDPSMETEAVGVTDGASPRGGLQLLPVRSQSGYVIER